MSDADVREGGRVRCANPTCQSVVVVAPEIKRQIASGQVESINQFCQATGFQLVIDGGEPRLFCGRCAF